MKNGRTESIWGAWSKFDHHSNNPAQDRITLFTVHTTNNVANRLSRHLLKCEIT